MEPKSRCVSTLRILRQFFKFRSPSRTIRTSKMPAWLLLSCRFRYPVRIECRTTEGDLMNVATTLRTIILLCAICIVAVPPAASASERTADEGLRTIAPTLHVSHVLVAAGEVSEKTVSPTRSALLGRCEVEGRLQYEPCMTRPAADREQCLRVYDEPSIPARIPENLARGTNQKTFTGFRTPTAPT